MSSAVPLGRAGSSVAECATSLLCDTRPADVAVASAGPLGPPVEEGGPPPARDHAAATRYRRPPSGRSSESTEAAECQF